MSITSYKELQKVIEKAVKDSLKDLGEDIEDIVREEVHKHVYSSYSPVEYERTGDLGNSIESKAVGKSQVEIKHDTSKISATSVKTGASVGAYLPEIVHDTGAPNIFNSKSYPWMKSRPYMTKAVERLGRTNEHVSSMKKSLKAKGLNVN